MRCLPDGGPPVPTENKPRDVTPTERDYMDMDLTDVSPAQRSEWINGWLETYRSVELMYARVENKRRLIARLWSASR